jgi:hypothetical protein
MPIQFSNSRTVIPGWSAGPDLRCAIAHRGISRFQVRCSASPWNDSVYSKHHVAISRRDAPELCIYLSPQGGRGECRVPVAPAVSCALCVGRTHTSNNEYTGTPGIPARNGFTAYVGLSPVTGLFCHRRSQKCSLSAPGRADMPSCELDASVGASGPHDFAVREKRLSSACY